MIGRERVEWEVQAASRHQAMATAQAEVTRLDMELDRLTEAVAMGGDVRALVAAMQAKQHQRDEAAARLEHAQGIATGFDPDGHHRAAKIAHQALTDLRASLERRGADGHETLRELIRVPITVTEIYWNGIFDGWHFRGEASLFALFGRVGVLGAVHRRAACHGRCAGTCFIAYPTARAARG
jgi:hypothetical protein